MNHTETSHGEFYKPAEWVKPFLTVLIALLLVGCTGKGTTYNSTAPQSVFNQDGSVGSQTLNNTYSNVDSKTVRYIRKADLAQAVCMFQAANYNQYRIIAESESGFVVYNQLMPPFNMTGCIVETMKSPTERIVTLLTNQTFGLATAVLSKSPYYFLYKLGKQEKIKVNSQGAAYVNKGSGTLNYQPDNSVREGVCIGEVAEDGQCVQPLPEPEGVEPEPAPPVGNCPPGQVGVPPDQCFTPIIEENTPSSSDELTRLRSQ